MKKVSSIRLVLLACLFLLTLPVVAALPEDGRFPKDPKIAAVPEFTAYWKSDYKSSRADFLNKTKKLAGQFSGTELKSIPVPSKLTGDLFVDVFYIPALKSTKNLLIISCGIHGIEGFAGSAIERMIMDRYLTKDNLQQTGILLIHAMNPYGFNFLRRVTENNVDMNRNCDATPELFSIKNDGYAKLYSFINPDKPASLGSCQNLFFVERAILKILKATMPVLRQAVLQGQYQYPEGLYFGGKQFEPQVTAIMPVIKGYAQKYDEIVQIDLHTGYGARGQMHLFPNPAKTPEIKTATEKLYEGYQIDWGNSKDFYTITGDFSNLVSKLVTGKKIVPMTLEFGTMDSQKTMGSLRSIQNMILENQGFHHGYKNKRTERKVKEWVNEMYNPSSPVWRTQVIDQSVRLMDQVFNKLR